MNYRVWLLGLAAMGWTCTVQSELTPISDDAMSEVTGQAFISIDRNSHPDAAENTVYTRVNLGMDIEIQTEVDALELGRYNREGEDVGTSDVLINDFALGYINNQAYFDANPDAARQRKPDGTAYAEGDIVPFSISNPFLEFAFDEDSNEVVGVRLGFGDSMGILSGNIQNLTGDVNVNIKATGEDLESASSNGNLFDQIIVALAPYLVGSNAIQSKAQLVYGEDGDPRLGELDPVRATHAGVPNGEKFIVEDVDGATNTLIQFAGAFSSSQVKTTASCFLGICGRGDVHIIADECQVLGIDACFPLTNFESLPIGSIEEVNGERRIVAPESGLFLSFQTRDLDWLEDVAKTNPAAADYIRATSGGFFNIPAGAVEFSLGEALEGIDRYRTEYIDRGRGLF
ncbi:MAG: hypothetical protein R3175_17610 [Marinobacter sp.]|uniref:hypothetical protein n=1 Tax=Marinobacter sp. TaxID=50741 RepID=UPI00299E0A67|nr:hypothetical protein [Marinobacter sp.]MDX1757875.1 hypothetical protein [Marinobacter sp.]